MARINFSFPTSRLLIVIVPTLIMLSANAVVTEESRRCYWCGPLAEQVHRSQRAPSCDEHSDHVTNCDPGFTHCAVVATSPPYVESRLCVKLYQDECYPLYCNSSKTWRMTCPCQGDLCNGRNTERETDAFSVLPKLVMKTKSTRITKRTQKNVAIKFKQNKNENTLIITNISATDNNNAHIDDDDGKKHVITDIVLSNESNDFVESERTQQDLPVQLNHNNEKTLIVTYISDKRYTNDEEKEYSNTDIILLNESNSSILEVIKSNRTLEPPENMLIINENDNLFTTDATEITISDNIFNSDISTDLETQHNTKIEPQDLTIVENSITHAPSLSDVRELKPSEELPTAEALQQNASPVIVTEKTTLPPTTLNTDTTLQTTFTLVQTTEQTKTKKSEAPKITTNMFFWAFSYCTLYVIV